MFVLAPLVNWPTATKEAMVADSSETESVIREIDGLKKKNPADSKMAEKGPIKLSHKQLWHDQRLTRTRQTAQYDLGERALPKRKQFKPSSLPSLKEASS